VDAVVNLKIFSNFLPISVFIDKDASLIIFFIATGTAVYFLVEPLFPVDNNT
jgi:hypothetical protein